jgi:hypothetical protein
VCRPCVEACVHACVHACVSACSRRRHGRPEVKGIAFRPASRLRCRPYRSGEQDKGSCKKQRHRLVRHVSVARGVHLKQHAVDGRRGLLVHGGRGGSQRPRPEPRLFVLQGCRAAGGGWRRVAGGWRRVAVGDRVAAGAETKGGGGGGGGGRWRVVGGGHTPSAPHMLRYTRHGTGPQRLQALHHLHVS